MTPLKPYALIILALAATAALAAPATAGAQASLRVFRLPSQPLDQALLRFAVQGDVSVGWSGAARCGGRSRPVRGTLAPAAALARLLPPGCGFERVDPRTFRIVGPAAVPHAAASVLQPAAGAPAKVEELVVTAEKRPEPLIASPFPVAALSGQELWRLGGETFQAVSAQTVGVTFTNLGPGRNKIFVRGLSDGSFTGKTQSTVGLYLDDVPITYNAPDPDLRLVDVDRVEVLRGPQGTLYGSGSIGGIIRIVTAKPDPSGFAAQAGAEGALAAHGKSSGSLEGMLNLPLPAPGAAVRLVGYGDYDGGYIDNPILGRKDVNKSRRTGGRAALIAEAPGGWRLEGEAVHQSIDTADTQYARGAGGPLTRDTRLREPHDNDFSAASLTAARAAFGGELKISAAHVDHALDTRYDATGAFGTVEPTAFDQKQRARMSLAQAELSSAPGRLHWLAGLFASQTDQDEAADLTPAAGPGAARSVYRRADQLLEGAAYGEIGYDLTDRITLTGGGRAFLSRLTTRGSDFDFVPGAPPFDARLNQGGFAPKLRLAYAAAPDRVVYVQVQEGFRAGGFNLPALGMSTVPGEIFRPRFSPDRMWSYEIGGEMSLFDRRLTLRGAVFHARWHDVQTDQYLASGLPMTVNIGDGSNTGLETEVVWRPGAHLQLRANALLEDPQLTRTADVFPARPDIGLPGVPNQMGAIDALYGWTLAGGLRADLSAQFAYVGRSFLTFEGGAASRMGGYGVGRLAAGLAGPTWRAQAYLDNPTDETGNTFAFGNPFSREPQSTPLRPRSLGLRVERTF